MAVRYPFKKENVTSTQTEEIEILKEFWVIVNYRDCDPGSEFEIINQAQIHGNSWSTLEAGSEITIKFGNAKAQGEIVMISDDLSYLQKNFKAITEAYEIRSKSAKAPPPTRIVAAPEVYEFHTIQKQIIKVSDRETQTDPMMVEADFTNLKKDYESLQNKYDKLMKIFENVNTTFIKATNDINEMESPVEAPLSATMDDSMINEYLDESNLIIDESLDSSSSILTPRSNNVTKSDTKTFNKNIKKEKKELRKSTFKPDMFENISEDEVMVYIGVNETAVPKKIYDKIKWDNGYTTATRKLLMALFPRQVLATHSLTGKPSHAFHGIEKQRKMRLDQAKILDVVSTVSKKCNITETLVRAAITTKCADENKMFKKRLAKEEREAKGDDKENDEDFVPMKKFKFM